MYFRRQNRFARMQRPLFISERPPESKKIAMNSNLIQFLCKEANQAQVEAVLFEIDPHQLSALRELISNTVKRDKYTIDKYIDDRFSENRSGKKKKSIASAKKAIQKSKHFVDKLLNEKATRLMLRKNARLIKSVLNKGYKHYENRSGVTSVSTSNKTTKKLKSLKNGERDEQNSGKETGDNEQASIFEEEEEEAAADSNEEFAGDQSENVESEENYTDGEQGDDENDENESEQEYEDFGSETGRYETDNV